MELLSQHVQEGGEVKGAWGLGHHLVDVTVVNVADTEGHVAEGKGQPEVTPELVKVWLFFLYLRRFQVVLVDETVTVGVDHLEGLLELLELGLLEHGEDIGALGNSLLLSLITATHFLTFIWTFSGSKISSRQKFF